MVFEEERQMSAINDRPHRELHAGGICVHYWCVTKEGYIVAGTEADGGYATVEGNMAYPRFEVEREANDGNPWYKLRQLVMILDQAYQNGKRDKLTEFRDFIGVVGRPR
jgi:hypothetical protein